jgi:hypothetical protein
VRWLQIALLESAQKTCHLGVEGTEAALTSSRPWRGNRIWLQRRIPHPQFAEQ